MDVDNDETTPDLDEDREVSNPDTDQDDAAGDAADTEDEDLDGDSDEQADDDGEGDDDGLVEVEWEGKALRLTPEAKAALMRTADYTRKTQEVSARNKALEAREASLTQQATLDGELRDDRVQLALIEKRLTALDALDWDKLEEDEGSEEANKLFRQRVRLREQRDDLTKSVDAKAKDLTLKRQEAAQTAHAQAVEDCQRVLSGKDGIKGWSPALAEKLSEFAMTTAGYTPQEVLRMSDPRQIKLIHQAYVGAQALSRQKTTAKLEAADKTAPVKPPGGSSGTARRTTDSSGDGLSTAEWMRREDERVAAQRTAGRR